MSTQRDWDAEIPRLKRLLTEVSVVEVARRYRVSRQTIYNVLKSRGLYGMKQRWTKNQIWLLHKLQQRSVPKSVRHHITKTIALPETCPVLGISLEYSTSRGPNACTVIKVGEGPTYTAQNTVVCSRKAARLLKGCSVNDLTLAVSWLKNCPIS